MAKILIIEDQQVFQTIYQAIFGRKKVDILAAYDGKEGLKLARKHQPDIIVLDLMMPGIDGMQFLQNFKPKSHPETKVIVFSNVDLEDLKEAANRLGVYKYLVKAAFFTPKQLLATVDEALGEGKTFLN
jgi:DNA-binding response OmpR family regulator